MKYVLLVGVTVIVARVARARFRRAIGRQPAPKAPTPVRSSMSLALIVTIVFVAGPLVEAVTLAGGEPPRFKPALLWTAVGLAAPLAAMYSYRNAKAAHAPSLVVRQSVLSAYSFVGLAVGAASIAVLVSRNL